MAATLLLVDIQKDFHPGGSLAIPSAGEDAKRTAEFIKQNSASLCRIVMTMDSHHKLHIAHPHFWTDSDGKHPAPFTLISSDDVKSGKWVPRSDLKHPVGKPLIDEAVFGALPINLYTSEGKLDIVQYCIEYTRRLEAKGRFQLCIWPEHCLIGTEGHNVVDVVLEAVLEWSDATGGSVEWVHKGQNLLTEMYSTLCAEVPLDDHTSFNQDLFNSLHDSEKLICCGQALSHCVNYTVRDIVQHWPQGETNRLVILKDCTSSVPGFEDAGNKFLSDMADCGLQIETSETVKL